MRTSCSIRDRRIRPPDGEIRVYFQPFERQGALSRCESAAAARLSCPHLNAHLCFANIIFSSPGEIALACWACDVAL